MHQTYTGTFPFTGYSLYSALIKCAPLRPRSTDGRRPRRFDIITTYAIVNQRTGFAYVGSTADFMCRWRAHLCNLRAGRHANDALQAAFDLDQDRMTITILGHYQDTNDLILHEEIDGRTRFKVENLYNYKLGNTWINGQSSSSSSGSKSGGYKPVRRRRANSFSRWFDHTATRR